MTGKQRRYLRGLGQRLTPMLHVGHEGVSEAVVQQADVQLDAHELVKVRMGDNTPDDRHTTAAELARRTRADLTQVLGRTAFSTARGPRSRRSSCPRTSGTPPASRPCP
jgi:RNA-binding protein